jgi:two-component system cell cycle response regulator
LDNFKEINDRQGHAAGDDVLRKVADALRKSLRGTDVSARLGGDEFAVILPETDAAGAERVARRLLESVRQLRTAARASIGVALFESRGSGYRHDPLVVADEAMYEAKRAGGDRFVTRAAPVTSR